MRKVFMLTFICILSGLMLFACQRDEGVRAGNEQGTDTYQPRRTTEGEGRPGSIPATPAPGTTGTPGTTGQMNQDIRGELARVDMGGKTITVRLENGVEQTFKLDDTTIVIGLDRQQAKPGMGATSTRNLVGKEGSEVVVQWVDVNGAKTAAHVNVVDVRSSRQGSRKR